MYVGVTGYIRNTCAPKMTELFEGELKWKKNLVGILIKVVLVKEKQNNNKITE